MKTIIRSTGTFEYYQARIVETNGRRYKSNHVSEHDARIWIDTCLKRCKATKYVTITKYEISYPERLVIQKTTRYFYEW